MRRLMVEAIILHSTNVVISSTGTDIYSTFLGSLKGPKHGGANLAVKKQNGTCY